MIEVNWSDLKKKKKWNARALSLFPNGFEPRRSSSSLKRDSKKTTKTSLNVSRVQAKWQYLVNVLKLNILDQTEWNGMFREMVSNVSCWDSLGGEYNSCNDFWIDSKWCTRLFRQYSKSTIHRMTYHRNEREQSLHEWTLQIWIFDNHLLTGIFLKHISYRNVPIPMQFSWKAPQSILIAEFSNAIYDKFIDVIRLKKCYHRTTLNTQHRTIWAFILEKWRMRLHFIVYAHICVYRNFNYFFCCSS